MAREGINNYEEIFNCQVLDKYNLTDTKVPSVTVKGGHIRFNMNAIRLLDETPYIEILINPEEQYMLVVPCGQYDIHAIDWCKIAKKTGKIEPKMMRSKYLSPKLYKLMNWNKSNSYRVQCFYQSFGRGKSLLYFDLTEYVPMVSTIIETSDGKQRKRSKPYYLTEWQESFGPSFQEVVEKVNQDFTGYFVSNPNEESAEEQYAVFGRQDDPAGGD